MKMLRVCPRPVPSLGLAAAAVLLFSTLQGVTGPTNGYATAWGNFPPDLPSWLTNEVGYAAAVAAGNDHGLALRPNGTVEGWPRNIFALPQATPPSGLAGVRAIAAGGYHSLALKSNGTVVAWGAWDGGQTNVPSGLTDARAIAAGQYYSLALRSNGQVVAWGSLSAAGEAGVSAIAGGGGHFVMLHSNGVVTCYGDDGQGQCTVPNQASLRAKTIAAGLFHSLALTTNGIVTGWGYNAYGQSATFTWSSNVAMLAGGDYFSLGLLNHEVNGWGDNSVGQLSPPSPLTNVVAISSGWDWSLAVRVVPPSIFTQPQSNQVVAAGTSVTVSVGAGGGTPLYYQWRKNGSDITGATDSFYNLPAPGTNDTATYSVVVSNLTGIVISSNGTLTVIAPPVIISQPQSLTKLAGESGTSFSVTAGGTPPFHYQWRKGTANLNSATNSTYNGIVIVQPSDAGDYTVVVTNFAGSVTSEVATLTVHTVPTITNQPSSLSAYLGTVAQFHVGASNATSYQWYKDGHPLDGATGPDYLISAVTGGDGGIYRVWASNDWGAAQSSEATLSVSSILASNSTVITLGEQVDVWTGLGRVNVVTPPGLGDVGALSMGLYHGLARLADGTVIGWGDNTEGQALPPAGANGAARIAAGGFHSLALANGGTVIGWGANAAGQTAPPASATSLIAIAAGANHSLGLRANGTVVGWGTNNYGQASPPLSASNSITAIAAGYEHSLVLRANGTVAAWGRNLELQTLVPQTLTNPATAGVVAIAAGGYHSMALRSNGTVICWGTYSPNQSNQPPTLSNVVAIAAGLNHSLALKADGTVVGWGANNYYQIEVPAGLGGVIGIAAGGNRSLLLIQKRLKLSPPQPRPGGGYILYLANEDGTPVASGRLAGLQIRASTNAALGSVSWTVYSNGFSLNNGVIRWDDTNAAGLRWRFYESAEGR